jgi:hypothetical protein
MYRDALRDQKPSSMDSFGSRTWWGKKVFGVGIASSIKP